MNRARPVQTAYHKCLNLTIRKDSFLFDQQDSFLDILLSCGW